MEVNRSVQGKTQIDLNSNLHENRRTFRVVALPGDKTNF